MLPMPIGQLHGRVVNPGLVEEERRRRISVLRFGFLACFVLLAFGHSGNKTQSNLRGLSNEKKEYEEVSKNQSFAITQSLFGWNESSPFALRDFSHINVGKDPADISGMFRGQWGLVDPRNGTQSTESGRLLMQLKSVVIKNLNSLRYVYGIIRIYSGASSVSGDMMLPVQGILEVDSNIITLLTTSQTSQFVAMKPMDSTSTKRRKNILNSMNATSSRRLLFKYPDVVGLSHRLNGNLSSTRTASNVSAIELASRGDLVLSSTNDISEGFLRTFFGPNGTEVELSRVQLDKIISGEVMKANYIPLGVDVLTESFHNLQSQMTAVSSTSKIGVCFKDAVMRFFLSEKPGDIKGTGDASKNSARMSGTISSPSCPQYLNLTTSVLFIRFDELESKAEVYGSLALMIEVYQIALIVLQMKSCASYAGFGKISMLCISGQAVLDALICIGHILLCAAVPSVFFFHFIWVAIASLLLFSVFEMKTVFNILQARHSTEDWSVLRGRMTSLQSKFYCALFFAMASVFILQPYPSLLLFILYSVWVPQILYSIQTGSKKPLLKHYYLGTGISRLFIPLYIYGCPQNIFSHMSDTPVSLSTVLTLVLWTAVQLSVLYMQDQFGPRFFVPKFLLPEKYDYCRNVPVCERDGECTICYTDVDISQREYMITPCDHIFHGPCLSQWMDIKLECPVCRSRLPAID